MEEDQTGGRWWPRRLLPVLWLLLAFLTKAWYLDDQLGITELPAWAHLYPAALTLGLGLLALLLPARFGLLYLWSLNLFWSLIGLADLLYYRGMNDLPSVSMLVGVHQLPVIRGAIQETLLASDWLLVVDLTPTICIMPHFPCNRSMRPPAMRRSAAEWR